MFQLDSAYRPKRRKVKGENNPNNRQTVLFAGMSLLPGQQDLFPIDGAQPQGDPPCSSSGITTFAASETASSIGGDGGSIGCITGAEPPGVKPDSGGTTLRFAG